MTNTITPDDIGLRASCVRWLSSHGPAPVRETLALMQHAASAGLPGDYYGMGGAVAQLETKTAALLTKEAATFVIKGMIAQTALLRTVTETRSGAVVVPTLGHMAIDEGGAIHHLLDAKVIELGAEKGFDARELDELGQPIAVCVVELPVRRAAYQLMPWAQLQQISAWCRLNDDHLHIDGARIWEASAGYGMDLAEISALADTVYVSYYKGLGGLAGAAVAGDKALLDRFQIWKKRFGGDLHTAFPFALSALDGLEGRLPRMSAYLARARSLAALLRSRGFRTIPDVPDVNAFQVILPGEPTALMEANRAFARRRGIWLFNALMPYVHEGFARAEIVIGDAAETYSNEDCASWIHELVTG